MAAEFQWCCDIVYFIHEITECRAVTRQKGEKILRRAEDWECFQWKTFRSCSRRDACSFPHTHATGDREDNVEWSGDTQEILTKSKQETDWRKSLYNPQASPATWAKNPLSTVCDYRHHPVCRGYKQMHSWLLLLMSTSWWWEKPQREVKEQLLFWGKKKRVQGCASQHSAPKNSILRKAWELGLWTLRRDTPWNSHNAPGTKLKFGKEKGFL